MNDRLRVNVNLLSCRKSGIYIGITMSPNSTKTEHSNPTVYLWHAYMARQVSKAAYVSNTVLWSPQVVGWAWMSTESVTCDKTVVFF